MPPIIEIHDLGKKYSIAGTQRYLALRDLVAEKAKRIFKSDQRRSSEFWALQDINLQIERGERIGIIGRNGAGKSTLLKIISKITPPTTGEIKLRGRVASLLEIGTGFHPELTGRENIYFNGSVLGLSKKEIDQRLDEIIDFSGIEKFIDTQLKHYSSGMQLRLAFSVAAHLEPEILLIDEVLAVGDMEFQQKCLGKMEEVSLQHGRTILFVSHNLSAIGTLTNKSLLIDKGQLIEYGQTSETIAAYTKTLRTNSAYSNEPDPSKPVLTKVELQCSEGSIIQAYGKSFSVIFEVFMPEESRENMALSFQIVNSTTLLPVLHYHLFDIETPSFRRKGANKLKFTSHAFRLYKGKYFLRVYLAESKTKIEFERRDCCYFQLEMIGIDEIEWGWADDMCQYLDEGKWEIE